MFCEAHAADLSPADAGLKFLTAFRDCQARHDVPACSAMVADDAMLYGDNGRKANKKEFLKDVAPPANPKPSAVVRRFSEPDDVKGWRSGDLLYFNYVSVWTEMYGEQPYRFKFRGTLVLSESESGTKLQLFQATLIPNTERRPAKIDSSVVDQYVGEYSAYPGDQELITREGNQLFLTLNQGYRSPLQPIDASSFYVTGESDDWVFVRNPQGEVTGLESRFWGQNVLAKRVR
jgi:hypothetical protein